ncbi:MAG: hypothetical protein HYV09_10225 [Deltaproteobacteria bacterium]|nr:hypothetical protein [Deltaproteobacteria bacterium]
MGVFDFVKHGTEEMRLARPKGSRDPVAVHDEPTLPVWGLLDVGGDEVAAFARDGKVIGLVGPGRHTVHASKLAFLEGVADDKGRLPVQLVFVRLTPIDGVPFSAMLDPLADPCALDAVRPLIDGELTVQVVDPIAFVEDHLAASTAGPLLARRGVVATLDGVRLSLEGRTVPVFAGARLARRAEPRRDAGTEQGRPLACRACGEPGEAGRFCAACGALISVHRQCVSCRAELDAAARFCLACGTRVTQS